MLYTAKPVLVPAFIGAMFLAGCDQSTPIVEAEPIPQAEPIESPPLLDGFEDVCEAGFAQEGVAPDLAKQVCACSIAKIEERELGTRDLVDAEKMAAIGQACMTEATSGESAPAG